MGVKPGPINKKVITRPRLTRLEGGLRKDKENTLVETAFGLAQKGSVLSYQQPIMPTKSVNMHQDCPSYPRLPLGEYRLDPTKCMCVCTEEEHFHLKSLMITLDMAYKIDAATREQTAEEQRNTADCRNEKRCRDGV
ncbi:hypothetical protein G5714_016500 [Onychostoma macrolepis]|uniref:Uncharacterized protein n=1 Tax=Onychostoma macrolepis TaxID=369639 RepID=A0A7J6C8I0_9TELE|nr:hypothetical protein G5714_016500 [Onychostoma macrolepis]